MSYEINQIFTNDDDYTNKAKWCNENGCYIEEIKPSKNGARRFQIKQCEKIGESQIRMKSTSTSASTLENAEKRIEDLQTEISQLTTRIEQLEKERGTGK